MRILVLGGAGYIGSHFVKQALTLNHQVIIVDNLSTGHIESIPKQVSFYQGDMRDSTFMDSVFSRESIDVCVHFSALSLVGDSMKNPIHYFDNNVIGAIKLIEVMNKYNVKQLVFSSTAAVYGAQTKMPITEEAITKPTNPYGESKLMIEKILYWADQAYGIKHVNLRYFNVAGASEDATIGEVHHPETHLIPNILFVPLGKNPEFHIYGDDYNTKDGTCIRDFIHVSDLINAHFLAIDYLAEKNLSNTFNLGTESGYSVLEVLNKVKEITNQPIPSKINPRRPGDPDILVASANKAKENLKWQVKNSLSDIISTAWDFHKIHPDGYKGERND